MKLKALDKIARNRQKGRSRIVSMLVVFALLAAVGVWKVRGGFVDLAALTSVTMPEEVKKAQADKVIAAVSKLFAIPEGTVPTVAQVVDVEQLREKDVFYRKAENGQYVVITGERALLYDAKRNILVDVMPIEKPKLAAGTEGE